jgi:hypothetical protein
MGQTSIFTTVDIKVSLSWFIKAHSYSIWSIVWSLEPLLFSSQRLNVTVTSRQFIAGYSGNYPDADETSPQSAEDYVGFVMCKVRQGQVFL